MQQVKSPIFAVLQFKKSGLANSPQTKILEGLKKTKNFYNK